MHDMVNRYGMLCAPAAMQLLEVGVVVFRRSQRQLARFCIDCRIADALRFSIHLQRLADKATRAVALRRIYIEPRPERVRWWRCGGYGGLRNIGWKKCCP